MARYKIEYSSKNFYDHKVTDAVFEFNIVACQDKNQYCIQNKKENSLNESLFAYENKFGFEINRIRTVKPFTEMIFKYDALVDVQDKPIPFASVLKANEELEIMNSNLFYIDNHIFIRKTPLTKLGTIPDSCPILKEGQTLFEYLTQVNEWIYKNIEYVKNVTTIKTTAAEVVKLKKGVCQDYVHLFLGICRFQNIPCRYVSGYLNQDQKHRGDTFMHAWVEVLIPEMGWVGFDPTNKILIDKQFIKVSHGADYTECTPIKGVLYTNGEQEMKYKIIVVEQ